MAFSDFDLRTAVRAFGLIEERDTDLFSAVEPVELSPSLRTWLDRFAPVALGLNTEGARRGYITTPLLAEMGLRVGKGVNVLPGVPFDVDCEQGLIGYCYYLIARSPEIYYLQAPLVAVVEANKEDLIGGLGRCAAGMVAIRLFNERDGTPVPAVFACVTSGTNWRFLKLEGSRLYIDRPEYYLTDAGKIVGILVGIARA